MDRLDDDRDPWARPGREAHWRRKLGGLRLGAEPVEEQVERHRRTTIVLSGVASVIGVIFLAIFGAFGRPDVGGLVVLVLVVPLVGFAWLDHAILRARASAYHRERADHSSNANPPG